jgi:hypothetical protein
VVQIHLKSNTRWQVSVGLESYRQAQLLEVLRKRIDTYPKLWHVLITQGVNWLIEDKPLTESWATEFLNDLHTWNSDYGVFFSQQAYEKFHQLRMLLVEFLRKLAAGEELSNADRDALGVIIFGDQRTKEQGISTALKADLGSYSRPAIRPGPLRLGS